MIENLENNSVNEQENPNDATNSSESTEPNGSDEGQEVKTFTQEQVNEIVTKRLERQKQSALAKYDVKDEAEFENLIGISQAYSVMKERSEKDQATIKDLQSELTLLKNKISPNRYEDVKAYFKGKELDFNNDSLIAELKTHPEWLETQPINNPTKIDVLGTEQGNHHIVETEDEQMKRIFGI